MTLSQQHDEGGAATPAMTGGVATMGEEPPERTAAAIFGCAGTSLSDAERGFFREAAPWGFILFRRNVDTPEQLARLTRELRECVGWNAPVLIDQEGGRVARLRAPHWRDWPAVGALAAAADAGRLSETALWELLALRFRLIARELRAVGVDVNCMPLLDLRLEGADEIIGDRALGAAPETIAGRGAVICAALAAGGVAPVIKHLPGHGRAEVDTHEVLPVVRAPRRVLEREDLAPFHALREQPIGMTAHIVYADIDSERPATLSPIVIEQVIRGRIGFDGLLLTDDLSMGALAMRALTPDVAEAGEGAAEDFTRRAAEALAAGCDIALHCNGDPAEMAALMRGVRPLTPEARRRSAAALAARGAVEPFEPAAALADYESALAAAGASI